MRAWLTVLALTAGLAPPLHAREVHTHPSPAGHAVGAQGLDAGIYLAERGRDEGRDRGRQEERRHEDRDRERHRDGGLTREERQELHRDLDAISREIYDDRRERRR